MIRFSTLDVVVRTCSGESLQFHMRPQDTVLGLQHKIAQHWHVPRICIVLAVGTDTLIDRGVKLADVLAETTPPLTVTAVLSSEPLHKQVLTGSPKEREMAVDDLLQVADRDYDRTVEVLGQCLNDGVYFVRAAATYALGKIARRSDPSAVAALATRLTDSRMDVQQAALDSLGPLLNWDEKGEGGASAVLKVCFNPNAPSWMKSAASDIIGDTAPRGNQDAIQILVDALNEADGSRKVRRSLVTALGKTAQSGDESVVTALCRRAKDGDWEIRAGVLTALAMVASVGDPLAIAVTRELEEDPEYKVRDAACAALSRLVGSSFESIE